MNKILDFFIIIFANTFGFILSLIGDKIFYFCVRFVAFLFKSLDKRRKFDCLNNLDFIYGDKRSSVEKQRILHRAYENFAFVLLNSLRLLFMDKAKYLSKFQAHNTEIIENAINGGDFLVITAHYGDWEATARWIAANYPQIKLSVVGRMTNFSSINALMEKSRETFGSAFVDKKGASKVLVRLLKEPNNAIGLVIDQHISPNEGIWVEFFGREVTHTPIAAILSRKYNIPIIAVRTTLNDDYSGYNIYFDFITNAIISKDSKADIAQMTQLQANWTQQIIEEKPDEWFWFHKRFKAKYNDIYTYKSKN
ncbi:hypothetical protein CCY99_01360 [Helicobacter sp. 16-1353]|uniref:lipid A biosynthesis lauroyl acyltransferase n=1 Tax=Helicobacter sp. 16-1353 TaxID=2004996 RepID=UPI000DCCEAEF|nr:lipid A biosynthesis lauroyl acyltransferase [Helicobacter sp. 16-1353]RAX54835.1 hypothetical protein CCY99_01360 [Helicobacter sp. 16-1353]